MIMSHNMSSLDCVRAHRGCSEFVAVKFAALSIRIALLAHLLTWLGQNWGWSSQDWSWSGQNWSWSSQNRCWSRQDRSWCIDWRWRCNHCGNCNWRCCCVHWSVVTDLRVVGVAVHVGSLADDLVADVGVADDSVSSLDGLEHSGGRGDGVDCWSLRDEALAVHGGQSRDGGQCGNGSHARRVCWHCGHCGS